ncbi:hypothetical protein B0T20DRAFT_338123, partial [Sordaria brevicollis]
MGRERQSNSDSLRDRQLFPRNNTSEMQRYNLGQDFAQLDLREHRSAVPRPPQSQPRHYTTSYPEPPTISYGCGDYELDMDTHPKSHSKDDTVYYTDYPQYSGDEDETWQVDSDIHFDNGYYCPEAAKPVDYAASVAGTDATVPMPKEGWKRNLSSYEEK